MTILISAKFTVALLEGRRGEVPPFRGEVLISIWIPKSVVLIGGQRLFEAQSLLEEIW